jgi:urease accessory protein
MSQQQVLNSTKNRQGFQGWPSPDHTALQRQKSELSLEYAKRDGKTVLTHSRFSHPWYSFPPLYLDDTGCATTFLTNPSGGFVGGDDLSLVATLREDTHVLFTTPSATKIYRTLEKPAAQSIDLTVGPNAILEWVPELTIPFAGSHFEQTITVRLDAGASLILWDALAAGRIARGEQWAFSHFSNQIKITLSDGNSLEERYALAPTQDTRSLTFEQDWNYVGSLYIVSDKVPSSTWEQTKEELVTVIERHSRQVLGGVSETSLPGLVVKVLTRSAPELNTVLEEMWSVVRMNLWGTALPTLRRY